MYISYCDLMQFFPAFVARGGGWLDRIAESPGASLCSFPGSLASAKACETAREDCFSCNFYYLKKVFLRASFSSLKLRDLSKAFRGG